jgi:transcriptional regulator with XRE-family HTH domain
MFNIRLTDYRKELHLNQRQMADKLKLSESYYSMVESGKRQPSKNVLKKLFSMSDLSEEYWLYGIDKEDYISNKDDFKNIRKALDIIFELNVVKNPDEIFNENNIPVDSLGKLLIEALKKDINVFLEKKK